MLNHCTTLALFAAAALCAADIASLPLPIHCGAITAFTKTEAPQRFVNPDAAAAANDTAPAENPPASLTVSRTPDDGNCFAIVTVRLEKGRTLNHCDFILETDGGTVQPCLDMATATATAYDFRLKTQTGPGFYRLIFQCPKNAYEARLKLAYPALPMPAYGDFVITPRPAQAPAPAQDNAPSAIPAAN